MYVFWCRCEHRGKALVSKKQCATKNCLHIFSQRKWGEEANGWFRTSFVSLASSMIV